MAREGKKVVKGEGQEGKGQKRKGKGGKGDQPPN